MNILPIIALSSVAIGFFGAIDHTDRAFDSAQERQLTSYAASQSLSVQEVAARTPLSVDQPFCDDTGSVTETLAHDFAETEQETWVQGEAMTLQLWGSDVMGTWTLLHVGKDGISCVVSSGTGWTPDVSAAEIAVIADVTGA